MSNKLKPITEFSSEELLDLLNENPTTTSNFEYKNDILDFVSVYNLKDGDNKISNSLVYELYKTWSINPLNRNTFGKELCKLFVNRSYAPGFAIFLNKDKLFFLEKITPKKQNKTKRKQWVNHFKKFISKYELKSGRFFVKDVILYNLYDRWIYQNGTKKYLGKAQFLKFCKLFFQRPKYKIIKGDYWFSISLTIKEHLTPDLISLMKQK